MPPEGVAAQVDLRSGLGSQQVSRGMPARALPPNLRQPMKPAQHLGYSTPVGLRLGRSALNASHHHQTVSKRSTIRRRDRHRHRQGHTVEVSQQIGLPREISSAPGAQTSERELPVHAHTPHLVSDSTSTWFHPHDIVTPPRECLPSPGVILPDLARRFPEIPPARSVPLTARPTAVRPMRVGYCHASRMRAGYCVLRTRVAIRASRTTVSLGVGAQLIEPRRSWASWVSRCSRRGRVAAGSDAR